MVLPAHPPRCHRPSPSTVTSLGDGLGDRLRDGLLRRLAHPGLGDGFRKGLAHHGLGDGFRKGLRDGLAHHGRRRKGDGPRDFVTHHHVL